MMILVRSLFSGCPNGGLLPPSGFQVIQDMQVAKPTSMAPGTQRVVLP